MTTDTADRAALEREVEAYIRRPYVMEVVWDEDYWAATFPELPGLVAAADTLGELEQKIRDAKWSYFEAALEAGLPIAEPGGGGEPASGRVLLRLPKSLHRQVARAAARDGVSVNTFLVSAIAKDSGWRESHNGSKAPRSRAQAHVVEAREYTAQTSSLLSTAAPTPTTPAASEPEGLYLNAGSLFLIARAAYLSAQTPPVGATFGSNYPLVAVVFAAASLEGFINEIASLAGMESPNGDPAIRQFGAMAAEAEQGRGSISMKFQLAFMAFSGHALERGQQPYQDFDLLFALRNEVIHLQEDPAYLTPPGATVTLPKIARRLDSRGIKLGVDLRTNPSAGSLSAGSLFAWLSSPDVARWACSTAVNMVQALIKVIPPSSAWPSLSQSVRMFYSGTFSLASLDDPNWMPGPGPE